MAIVYLTISYPDFVLGTTANPEQFDQNNLEIVTKINEVIDTFNANETSIATSLADSATALSTANGAVTTANGAVTTANTASTNATNAVNTANTALGTANTASTTATSAQASATQAVLDAQTAQASASVSAQSALDAQNAVALKVDKTYVDQVAFNFTMGSIPDNTLSNLKLAVDVKVGSLATLITTSKNSVTDAINEIETDVNAMLATNQTQTTTLKHGQNLITTDRATPLDVKIQGRTLVNLLGRDGNCEDTNKWVVGNQCTIALDTTVFDVGTTSLKVTSTLASGTFFARPSTPIPVDNTKHYLLLGKAKTGTATNVMLTTLKGSNPLVGIKGSPYMSANTVLTSVYLKLSPTDLGTETSLYPTFNAVSTAVGEYYNFDGICLYEVDQTTYDKIDVDPEYTGDKLAEKFPYVDSYQTLQNPYVVSYGKNLLPPFSEWELNVNSRIVNSYEINHITTTAVNEYNTITIPALENTVYILSDISLGGTANRLWVQPLDSKDSYVGDNFSSIGIGEQTITFTTPIGTKKLKVNLYPINNIGENVTFSNPMLNLGSTALPFEPQDKSYFYTQTMLADGESIEEIDGEFVKTKKVNHPLVAGSENWISAANYTGFKMCNCSNSFKDAIAGASASIKAYATKYDGKILLPVLAWNAPDVWELNYASTGNFNVTVSSADSGWGDAYTPTADEIKAYFYGWTMYNNADGLAYNGTGIKNWAKLYCGIGTITTLASGARVVTTTGTAVLPTVMNDQGYTPYQIHYQLVTPTTEVVQTEGSLTLIEGANQVELGEGIVVREVANPQQSNVDYDYYINAVIAGFTISYVEYKISKSMGVFKNGVRDYSWVETSRDTYNGNYLSCKQADYDPTATYTITYLAQPYQFTASSPDQQATYSTNDHTVLQNVVSDVENIATRVSVVENEKANRKQSQWITPTLLNGWVNYDTGATAQAGYFKDEFGFIHFKGCIKSGTGSSMTPLFKLPIGYRPLGMLIFSVRSYSTVDILGAIAINPTGEVAIVTGSNVRLHLDNILFRAEQ